ncbi:MAG: hypothetical protein QMD99_25875 [Rhizobiaceae bacterium]|nr:hypothetical protein [Rhizobiaceae bacterium]
MRIDNYARVQDFARRQDDLNGLPDEMSQARHPRTTWALRKDSVDVPACVNGKKGETFAGEAKEVLRMRPQDHDIPQWNWCCLR